MARQNKPTALKALEGNKGKRGLNNNEPQPDNLNELEPSAWLPEAAQLVWRELAFKLRKAGVLTVIDVPALEKMCVAIATYRRATLALYGVELVEAAPKEEKAGGDRKDKARPIGFTAPQVDADKPGEEKTKPAAPAGAMLNPWAIVQSMSFKQATLLMRDFGMTPAARSRVLVEPNGDLFGNGSGQSKEAKYFGS
jgi:P27 family predicted phage terminase small subunit